jgi:DNA-binding transcriptional MerR regulator
MKTRHLEPMTLPQLAAAVADALAVGYQGARNGQVSPLPSPRTIRYYTALGLLDKPIGLRGRTALYGPRHLLQLVAIKRLQEQGLALVEVQERLAGRTDAQLRAILAESVSAAAATDDCPDRQPLLAAAERSTGAFWAERRAAAAAPHPTPEGAPGATLAMSARTVQQVALGMDVTLTLPACQPLLDHDLDAIRHAAGELLRVLHERQILAGEHR